MLTGFNNGRQSIGGDETHDKKCLEDGKGELRSLAEEFSGFSWVGCGEGFHL